MLQNPLAGILPPDQADLVLIMIITIPLSFLLSLIYNKYIFLANEELPLSLEKLPYLK